MCAGSTPSAPPLPPIPQMPEIPPPPPAAPISVYAATGGKPPAAVIRKTATQQMAKRKAARGPSQLLINMPKGK